MIFLEVKDLKSGYSNKLVIKGISFSVEKSEFIGIIGPNGAGKTTLLKTLTHILKPTEGKVILEGSDIHSLRSIDVAKKIALVTQDLFSIFSFNVKDIVLMGRTPYMGLFGDEKEEDLRITKEIIRLLDLEGLENRPIDELSAGERQRTSIAKALAQTPSLLLLDEPTAHLDIGHQVEILDLTRSLKEKRGLTIISVFHDLNLASQYCDRVMLLNKGVTVGFATPKDILNYETIEKVFNVSVLVNDKTFPGRPLVTPFSKKSK